jgi:hypothetical protein
LQNYSTIEHILSYDSIKKNDATCIAKAEESVDNSNGKNAKALNSSDYKNFAEMLSGENVSVKKTLNDWNESILGLSEFIKLGGNGDCKK